MTKEIKLEWGRAEWSEWRRSVFERDKYTCQMCGANMGGNLEAHHIIRRKEAPDLSYIIGNGITLCITCHREVTGNETKYESTFFNTLGIRKHTLLPRPDLE